MLAFALFMLSFLVLIILEKYCDIFFILIFSAFLEKKYEYLGITLSDLNKTIDFDRTDQYK